MQEAEASRQQRDLRAMLLDGVFFSVMVGVGETYLPAFVLAGGLGEVAAGLVATLPVLAGSVLQLVTPLGVRALGSYRRWVVGCARLQALCFLPLVVGALAGSIRADWVFLAAAAYWGFGMATGPAWNAWVGALVPAQVRAHFFARRARLAQSALLAGVLAGGLLLDVPSRRGDSLAIFALLFALAGAARLLSSRFLARQSEPPGLAATHRQLPLGPLWAAVRGSDAGRLLGYLLGMQVAVHVAAPFFTPYMLRQLELSYSGFMTLTAAAFVARIAVLPLLGPMAHRIGTRRVLHLGAAGIVPLPALWLVSDHFVYLLAVQVVAGSAWAAVEYATQLSFFESLEERDRTSILTFFNLANTLAMVAGSLLGAACFGLLETGRGPYALLFVASSLARLAPLAWLRRARLPEIPTAPVVLRTLAVRPSAGALQRPILASLEAAEAAEAQPAAEPPEPA